LVDDAMDCFDPCDKEDQIALMKMAKEFKLLSEKLEKKATGELP